jgi:transcriptional regulator of met regulon
MGLSTIGSMDIRVTMDFHSMNNRPNSPIEILMSPAERAELCEKFLVGMFKGQPLPPDLRAKAEAEFYAFQEDVGRNIALALKIAHA